MTFLDAKSGQHICTVCGHYWADHGLGGNCLRPPLAAHEQHRLLAPKTARGETI